MMEIYAFTTPRSSIFRLRRPAMTSRPKGSEPNRVSRKIASVVRNPCPSRENMVETFILFAEHAQAVQYQPLILILLRYLQHGAVLSHVP